MRKGLVAANWKMHGSRESNAALLDALVTGLEQAGLVNNAETDVLICPPSVYLDQVRHLIGNSKLLLGAQNVHSEATGAFTGENSASMLRDIGCSHVIIGHSERREIFAESDSFIAAKFSAAQANGLIPILCVGETQEQREAGETKAIVLRQLAAVLESAGIQSFNNAVVAYEPVWAIGTGLTATPEQAQEVHALIRNTMSEQDVEIANNIQILYGGSVKGANAVELFAQPDIDGGLVGGASLDAEDFIKICSSFR